MTIPVYSFFGDVCIRRVDRIRTNNQEGTINNPSKEVQSLF